MRRKLDTATAAAQIRVLTSVVRVSYDLLTSAAILSWLYENVIDFLAQFWVEWKMTGFIRNRFPATHGFNRSMVSTKGTDSKKIKELNYSAAEALGAILRHYATLLLFAISKRGTEGRALAPR